ncbi:hypothetical protein C3943_22960 [Lysinibacillus sp. B2A1]|nr:hypothetical protein C3943_22960 [Lysinibacillus sp. B2A1]
MDSWILHESIFSSSGTFEWKSLSHAVDVVASHGVKKVDHSTLSKRLEELDYVICLKDNILLNRKNHLKVHVLSSSMRSLISPAL